MKTSLINELRGKSFEFISTLQFRMTNQRFCCHEHIFHERNTLYRNCNPNLTQKVQENIITIARDAFSGYHQQPLPAKRIHAQITWCKSLLLSLEYFRISVALAIHSNSPIRYFVYNCQLHRGNTCDVIFMIQQFF